MNCSSCVSLISKYPTVFMGKNARSFPFIFPSVLVKRITSGGHLGWDGLRACLCWPPDQVTWVRGPGTGVLGIPAVAPPTCCSYRCCSFARHHIFLQGEAEQICGQSKLQGRSAPSGEPYAEQRFDEDVNELLLTVKIALQLSVVVRLWQAYWETSAGGAPPSGMAGSVSCVHKHAECHAFTSFPFLFVSCKCVLSCIWLVQGFKLNYIKM